MSGRNSQHKVGNNNNNNNNHNNDKVMNNTLSKYRRSISNQK
jgi:hypothetical protein